MNTKGPTIIVEHDLEDREIMQEIFTELGITNELRFFMDGGDVLQYLRKTTDKPFLILTDVNMPGINGLELREEIMKEDHLRRKSIPFVFLSTSDGSQIINKVYDLQVQGYFQKQTSFPEIKKQIKMIVDYWAHCKHPNS